MKNKIKKMARNMMLSLALAVPSVASAGWMNVQPAQNLKQDHAVMRLEGGADLSKRLNLYAFGDFSASKEKPKDFESFYAEARLGYSLSKLSEKLKGLEVAVEYNGGSDMKDLVRCGLVFKPELDKKTFALLKYLPKESTGEKGAQASLYAEREIFNRVFGSVLIDYNLKPKTVLGEFEANVKLTDKLKVFGQARGFNKAKDLRKTQFEPVVGIKYNF